SAPIDEGAYLAASIAKEKVGCSSRSPSYCEEDPFYGLLLNESLSFFDIAAGRKGLSEVLTERERENRLSRLILARTARSEFTADPEEEFDEAELDDIEVRDINPDIY
ncbi:hypothetical protein, partial [Rhizobium phaseoli]|uniref:hypothetical protein n=1 Tax=Rhizobium phaseoli TaxID=396 RepID=UPI00148521FE